MSTLKEFRDMVNQIDDPKMLDVADGLLKDLAAIQNMKEKIEMLEATLTEGDRAAFWYFAIDLDPEQVAIASNTVIGRKRIIDESVSRELNKKAKSRADSEVRSQEEVIAEYCLSCEEEVSDCICGA